MYYYKKQKRVYGNGLIDSLIGAVTSQAAKEVAKQVATKTLTEVGNRASQKIINKIIPPRKGGACGSLNQKSLDILSKYNATPIEDYVRK